MTGSDCTCTRRHSAKPRGMIRAGAGIVPAPRTIRRQKSSRRVLRPRRVHAPARGMDPDRNRPGHRHPALSGAALGFCWAALSFGEPASPASEGDAGRHQHVALGVLEHRRERWMPAFGKSRCGTRISRIVLDPSCTTPVERRRCNRSGCRRRRRVGPAGTARRRRSPPSVRSSARAGRCRSGSSASRRGCSCRRRSHVAPKASAQIDSVGARVGASPVRRLEPSRLRGTPIVAASHDRTRPRCRDSGDAEGTPTFVPALVAVRFCDHLRVPHKTLVRRRFPLWARRCGESFVRDTQKAAACLTRSSVAGTFHWTAPGRA